jgi:ribosome-associated protein
MRGRSEGLGTGSWALLDFGDVVVHVFGEEARKYYALDLLWGDAALVPWEDAAAARSASAT